MKSPTGSRYNEGIAAAWRYRIQRRGDADPRGLRYLYGYAGQTFRLPYLGLCNCWSGCGAWSRHG